QLGKENRRGHHAAAGDGTKTRARGRESLMRSVRPLAVQDLDSIVDYFYKGTPEFYERMGLDSSKLPSPDVYRAGLATMVGQPPETAKACYSIWVLDGEPIGHSSLKEIEYGKFGSQHLHVWKAPERGKGHGAVFFCLSALDFYE